MPCARASRRNLRFPIQLHLLLCRICFLICFLLHGSEINTAGSCFFDPILAIILFSTVIEEKNERKAFEIGPNAHFYLDENVVWDLHFIIFFDICSMFLVNSISCPVEDGTAAPGNPVHPILYNRPDNRCPGNSPHSCSSMSPISDLV